MYAKASVCICDGESGDAPRRDATGVGGSVRKRVCMHPCPPHPNTEGLAEPFSALGLLLLPFGCLPGFPYLPPFTHARPCLLLSACRSVLACLFASPPSFLSPSPSPPAFQSHHLLPLEIFDSFSQHVIGSILKACVLHRILCLSVTHHPKSEI